jgi:hypothetical protein
VTNLVQGNLCFRQPKILDAVTAAGRARLSETAESRAGKRHVGPENLSPISRQWLAPFASFCMP